MPLSGIERAIRDFQNRILAKERRAAGEMVRAYFRAWKRVRDKLEKLQSEYDSAVKSGEPVNQNWIYQNSRLLDLQELIGKEMQQFSVFAERRITQEQRQAIVDSLDFNHDMIILQLGPEYDVPGTLRVRSLPTRAIETMIGMNQIGSPLRRLFSSIPFAAVQEASAALIEGLILGYNPRKIAPMVRDALGVQLNRALTISRTEVLRAHREAAQQTYEANADVVKGWRWQAALSGNTCAVCISLHGREFPMSEKMSSHPNCRCCAAPITYSWEELGKRFGVDWSGVDDAGPSFEELAKKYKMTPYPVRFTAGTSAPAELLQIARYRARTGTGVDYFKSLTPEEQRKILGNAKWLAWKEGKFAFDDIWKSTWSDEWGAGKAAASLNELVGEDEAKRYFTLASLKKSVGWADAGEDQTFIAGKLSEFVREKIGDIVSSDTINMTNSVREHVQKHSNEFDVERAFTMLAGIIDNPLYIMQGKKSNSLQFVDDFDDKFFVLVPIKHLPEEMWVETMFIEEKNRFIRRWRKRTVYYERK